MKINVDGQGGDNDEHGEDVEDCDQNVAKMHHLL